MPSPLHLTKYISVTLLIGLLEVNTIYSQILKDFEFVNLNPEVNYGDCHISADGGLFIHNFLQTQDNPIADPALLSAKINQCQEVEWAVLHKINGTSTATSLKQQFISAQDSGLIYIVADNTKFENNIIIISTHRDGNLEWARYVDITGVNPFYNLQSVAIHQLANGNVISGISVVDSRNDSSILFVNGFGEDGKILWSRKLSDFGQVLNIRSICSLEDKQTGWLLSSGIISTLSNNFVVLDSIGRPLRYMNLGITPTGGISFFWLETCKSDSSGRIICSGIYVNNLNKYLITLLKFQSDGNSFDAEAMTVMNPRGLLYYTMTDIVDGHLGILGTEYGGGPTYLISSDTSLAINLVKKTVQYGMPQGNAVMQDQNSLRYPTHLSNSPYAFSYLDSVNIACGEESSTVSTATLPGNTSLIATPSMAQGIIFRDTLIMLQPKALVIQNHCSPDLKPNPKVWLGSDTVLCTDTIYKLTAGSDTLGFAFKWNTGETGAFIEVDSSGTYTVEVNSNSCVSIDSVTIIYRSKARIVPSIADTICPYDSLFLTSVGVPENQLFWLSPSLDSTYSLDIFAKDTGIYRLVLNKASMCQLVDTFHLLWHDLPPATAGPDTLLCYNQEYTMQGGGGVYYRWIPDIFLSSDTIPDPIAHIPYAQPYQLIVGNKFGCLDTSHVLIEVRPPLQVQLLTSDTLLCNGDSLILIAKATGGDSLNYNYRWLPTQSSDEKVNILARKSGWFRITIYDDCSPEVTDSIFINVLPEIKASFSVNPPDSTFIGLPLYFSNTSLGASKYSWNFGNGMISNEFNPLYSFGDPGQFLISLVAYNNKGCSDTALKTYFIQPWGEILIPNAFSPNADGLNDLFAPISTTNIDGSWEMEIYNRWGELIWSGKNKPWNGKYSGKLCPEGIYLFKIRFTQAPQDKYLQGMVYLNR